MTAGGLGHETICMRTTYVGSRNVVLDDAGFSIPNGAFLHFFLALVVLEPLVSLMSRFGACSARTTVVDLGGVRGVQITPLSHL